MARESREWPAREALSLTRLALWLLGPAPRYPGDLLADRDADPAVANHELSDLEIGQSFVAGELLGYEGDVSVLGKDFAKDTPQRDLITHVQSSSPL